MIKEIHEQPQALRRHARRAADRRRRGRPLRGRPARRAAAPHAARADHRLRHVLSRRPGRAVCHGALTGLPVQVDLASEFRYRGPVLDGEVARRSPSPSRARLSTRWPRMRLAREAGAPVLALTNIMGSQATREADARALHPGRPRDRGGRHQDPRRPDRRPAAAHPAPGRRARHAVARRAAAGRPRARARCRPWFEDCLVANPQVEEIARALRAASHFFCTSAAHRLRRASRAPSSSRRSPTSRPSRTPPAR